MWSHPNVSSFKATSNLSEEEMEAFLSPFFFLPIGEDEKEKHRESHNFVGAVNTGGPFHPGFAPSV